MIIATSGSREMALTIPPPLAEVLAKQPIPQQAFPWKPAGWLAKMHDLPEVLNRLNHLPQEVDRTTVREVVLNELDGGHVLAAFVTAMVWGYGDRGYGPARVRWVFTGVKAGALTAPVRNDIADLLRNAVDVVRDKGPVKGFEYMGNEGRIKYLGSAFFTKWLYFASALKCPDDQNAAPILDKQVHDWLKEHAGVTFNISQTTAYESYLRTLTDWGKEYGRSPVQVEKAIFGLQTGRT
jgi:hypothetical protein